MCRASYLKAMGYAERLVMVRKGMGFVVLFS